MRNFKKTVKKRVIKNEGDKIWIKAENFLELRKDSLRWKEHGKSPERYKNKPIPGHSEINYRKSKIK